MSKNIWILSETVVITIPELNMSAFGPGGRSMCQNMGLTGEIPQLTEKGGNKFKAG